MSSERFKVVIAQITNVWEKNTLNDGGFEISWSTQGAGFGTTTFVRKNGQLQCYNECMGKIFIRAVLDKVLEDCVLMET